MALLEKLKRPTVNQLRLASGLVMAAFLVGHLSNHIFGLVSLQAADDARAIFHTFWHTPVGMPLLYSALTLHIGLGLRSLFLRRSLKMPAAEAVQLSFGLLVPSILLAHIANTRLVGFTTGLDVGYPYEIALLWIDNGYRGVFQAVLLILVWTHLCIGLDYSLRLRSWYPRARPWLLAFAVAFPLLALLGFVDMGQEVSARAAADPAWLISVLGKFSGASPTVLWAGDNGYWLAPTLMAALVGLALFGRFVRHLIVVRRGQVAISYGDGNKVKVARGASILEASRLNDIPHASFCGGRGRCTTCRVRIDAGADALPPPNAIEARALAKIGEPESVRLACQLRPTAPCSVAPLVAAAREHLVGRGKGGVFGEEKDVVVVFIDLRDSTTLAERRLPFDVVFILNQFFSAMSDAVERYDGHYSNFTGDGLMAMFGLENGVETGVKNAMCSAFAMLRALDALNDRMAGELERPLAIGVGVHVGHAIVGEMGPPKHPVLTALGDTVNTTARLESLTKGYEVPLIVSDAAARAGGLDLTGLPRHETQVKGRTEPVAFYAIPAPPAAEAAGAL